MKRSLFLSSMAAASAGAFLRGVALGDQAATDSSALVPLIETIAPIGSAGFPPLSGEQLARRTDELFHLSESPTFVASLGGFSRLADFAGSNAFLLTAERAANPASDPGRGIALDAAALWRSALPRNGFFADLDTGERIRYVELWSRSALSVRRRFYQSMRFVTFAACYSLPAVWPSIGYAGPLVGGR